MRWRPWLTLLPAASLAMFVAGCGDHDGGDSGSATSTPTAQSSEINYSEDDFALNPNLRANPDDVVTVQLEDPSGHDDDSLDTGEPGVDVIPYTYLDTAEHTFCWQIAGGAEAPLASGSPSYMRLMNDETGDVVLRVDEGGPCVTQTIASGRYSAVFHNSASASGDRDLLFIVPQAGTAPAAAPPPSALGEQVRDDDPPALENTASMPYCDFHFATEDPNSYIASAFMARVINIPTDNRQPCGTNPYKIAIELFLMGEGACTDLSLIRGACTPVGMKYLVATFHGYEARIYEDVFFRGPRKTVVNLSDLAPDAPAALALLFDKGFAVEGRGSMVMLRGSPAINNVFLILTGGCDKCDLSGVNLARVDLHGASLRQTDLSHASLEGANLSGIVAPGAIFKSAYLHGADLRHADLEVATFDSTGVLEGMSGQAYPAADLSNAKLDDALLTTASLRGATLTNATLTRASLDSADLSRVSATGAAFQDAMLRSAVLTDATLRGASLDRAHLEAANLQGADLINARLPEAHLDGAHLQKDQDHLGASLDGAYMANATLDSADLTGVSMEGTRFYGTGARAVNTIFNQAHLDGAILSGANFTGAFFQSASLANATCVNCSLNTARLGRTASQLTDAANLVGTDLRGADLTQATVDGCNFTGAIVSFDDTTGVYSYGSAPDVVYVTHYPASKMGAVMSAATVRCPSGAQGPCNTREKLTALQPTPTATVPAPSATPATGCTPHPLQGVFCPSPTPKP